MLSVLPYSREMEATVVAAADEAKAIASSSSSSPPPSVAVAVDDNEPQQPHLLGCRSQLDVADDATASVNLSTPMLSGQRKREFWLICASIADRRCSSRSYACDAARRLINATSADTNARCFSPLFARSTNQASASPAVDRRAVETLKTRSHTRARGERRPPPSRHSQKQSAPLSPS